MKNKLTYITNILMVIIIATSYLLPLTHIRVNAATTEANVTMKPTTKDSYKVSRNTQNIELTDIHAGDKVEFNYDWSWAVPSNQSNGTQYTFNYKLPQNINYMVEQGVTYGNYKVTNDGQVKFSFNTNLSSNRAISGPLNMLGLLLFYSADLSYIPH